MAERVATKPAFRDAFARRQRCIVPVGAFYEWKKTPVGKQPYAIVGADDLPLAMAGLWERWRDRGAADTVQTFTIITTVPNELCGAITTECRSSCHGRSGRLGWASVRPIRTSCGG